MHSFKLILTILKLYGSYLLQIDDLDVGKCRQGRLEYLGIMSFLIIAVPTTLILLNDKIGDALIDTALPSIFSGFFFVGSALFNVSLATLLVPIFLLLAVVLYFLCVYRPARAAYTQREQNMKILGARGEAYKKSYCTTSRKRKTNREYSHLQNFDHYFGRVVSIITHSAQHVVTYFSSYHMAVSRSKAYTLKKQWCDMNTPHNFQGFISAHVATVSVPTQSSTSRPHVKTVFLPPPEISNMMTSTTHWKRAYEEQMKNKKFADSLKDVGACVIIRKQSANMKLRQMKTLVMFRAAEALDSMRVRLITADVTCSREVLNRYCEVPFLDLFEEFRKTLNLFYPDGVEMTGEEKVEACEKLVKWKDEQNLRVAIEIVESALFETQMVDFLLFEKWFLGTFATAMHQISNERLLRHTLHHVPSVKKRVLNTATSRLEGGTQRDVLHSDTVIKTMKALSLINPAALVPLNSVRQLTHSRTHLIIDEECKG